MSIIDNIEKRRSVRSYRFEPISDELKTKIKNKISTIKPKFGAKLRFELIDVNDVSGIKLGTYGVISGATTFLVATYEKSLHAKLALGYAMEEIILYCTELDLGTCYLGGTYRKSRFAKAINLKYNENLSLISPIGYPSDNLTFMAKLFGSTTKPKTRKAFDHIFFEGDFTKSLNQDGDNIFIKPLAMFRLAPSAINAQPWVALVKDNQVHFFSSKGNYGYSEIDIGIALAHFDLTRQFLKIEGELVYLGEMQQYNKRNLKYIYSFQKQGDDNEN